MKDKNRTSDVAHINHGMVPQSHRCSLTDREALALYSRYHVPSMVSIVAWVMVAVRNFNMYERVLKYRIFDLQNWPLLNINAPP